MLDAKRAADRASGLQANTPALHHTCPGGRCQGTQCGASVAQPKRMSAGHPQRPVHAVLGGFMPMLFGASANLPTKYFTVIR